MGKKVFLNIVIYFLLFLFGDLFNSILFDLLFSVVKVPSRDIYVIARMLGCILFTILFFWIYTTKVLHLKMKDWGIDFNIKKWGIVLSVFLPISVVVVFWILGETKVSTFHIVDTILIVIASILTALKAGVLEEILFRGFIMKLLESKWNKLIAILVPSFLFSLLHIPSMETFSVGGIVLLIVAGTLVGIMFSLVTYAGKSVSNSALMHTIWNFVMITDILHITTVQGVYGAPIFSIIVPSNNILLTGAGFGVEASLVAIIGYSLVCGILLLMKRK